MKKISFTNNNKRLNGTFLENLFIHLIEQKSVPKNSNASRCGKRNSPIVFKPHRTAQKAKRRGEEKEMRARSCDDFQMHSMISCVR